MNGLKILISQPSPQTNNPYAAICQKFGATVDFKPLFTNQALSLREFRAQHVEIPEYTAIVFSSKTVIDAFFSLCEQLRVKIPDSQKYFCTTEAVAMYLQKHIVYRKRKIFFGTGTAQSILDLVGAKHAEENFLITTSGTLENDITKAFDGSPLKHTAAMFVKPVSSDLAGVDLSQYEVMVLYNKSDIVAIKENFPAFKQGNIKFITFGRSIVSAMSEAGLNIEISAPSTEVPSVAKALEIYLSSRA